MKKVVLWGVVGLSFVVIISIIAAMNFGEKSDIYVSGELLIPEAFQEQAAKIKTLFIVIYDENSPMPMPYGAMKLRLGGEVREASLPFFVTKERIMTMVESQPPPQRMRVKARLDLDGIAGQDQPGDLTGELRGVTLGSQDIVIAIDKKVSD